MNILEEIELRRERLSGRRRLHASGGMVIAPDASAFRRVLAVGDIHGYLDRLKDLMARTDYRPGEDLLIFLGDYIDRGPESAECLRFIMELRAADESVVTLTGNHEAMMLHYFGDNSIRGPMNKNHGWLTSGGEPTFASLRRLYERDAALYRETLEFVLSLNHIAAVGDRYLFSHAGFYPKATYAKQFDSMLWLREDFYRDYPGGKTVVIGHTPVQYFETGRTTPLVFPNQIIDCDTGSFLPGGCISCVDVKSGEYWQSGAAGSARLSAPFHLE